MTASDHLNRYQLRYRPTSRSDMADFNHQITALDKKTGKDVGYFQWADKGNSGRIWDIAIHEEHQRKGIATAMYDKADKLAEVSDRRIYSPEHSETRTPAGDAWAKKVGGSLPDNNYND